MPIPGKRKSLALYEVINERGMREREAPPANGRKEPKRPAPPPEPRPAGEGLRLGITPGQAIRVPVGYLFFTIALLVLVGVAGYSLGYHQHKRVVARREADERARMRLTDPLDADLPYETLSPGQGGAGGSALPVGGREAANGSAVVPDPGPPRQGAASRVVVVESGVRDPRRAGLNYVNLARFVSTSSSAEAIASSRGEAMRAAEYVASHGYEVGVYPSGRVFRLIALRPFESTGGDDYKAFARDLKQLGKRYKAQEDGPVDFADLWPQKHPG